MAPAADPGGGDWITNQSAKKKRQEKQLHTPSDQANKDKTPEKPTALNHNEKTRKTTIHTNKKRSSLEDKRIFPKYENDDAVRSISHQLHRYVHQNVDIDLIVDLFLKLRTAAQHKVDHPFYMEKWHFPYSQQEKQEIKGMAQEDMYEDEQTFGDDSIWNLEEDDAKFRLLAALKTWFYKDKISKEILARRARVLPLYKVAPAEPIRQQLEPADVPHHPPKESTLQRANELQQWKQYCVEPVNDAVKKRSMTTTEQNIMDAVFSGELELPFPPTFLKRVYTAQQQAVFTVFMSEKLHYTLTAKLAPDQSIPAWLEPHALRNLIKGGTPSPNALVNLITSFKERCIRIELDDQTRSIRCVFPGRRSAARWVNWGLPFAGKFLPLQDLSTGPTTANDGGLDLPTNEQYSLHVSTVGCMATVEDVYRAAAHGLSLDVQSISRPHMGAQILHDRQWKLVLRSKGCPVRLKGKTKWQWQGQILTAHHQELHSQLPCHKCYAPDHHPASCTVLDAELPKQRKQFLLTIHEPTKDDSINDIFEAVRTCAQGAISTLADFEAIIQPNVEPSRQERIREAKLQFQEQKKESEQGKRPSTGKHPPGKEELGQFTVEGELLKQEAQIARDYQMQQQQDLLAGRQGTSTAMQHDASTFPTAQEPVNGTIPTAVAQPNTDTNAQTTDHTRETLQLKAAIEALAPPQLQEASLWTAIEDQHIALQHKQEVTIADLMKMAYAKRVSTAGNGHCLFYAITKGLHPHDDISTATMHTTTALLKQLARAAFLQHPQQETLVSAVGVFTDQSQPQEDSISDVSVLTEYLDQINSIPPDQGLPRSLWGGLDVVRWIVKGLQRPVFIITPETTQSSISFYSIQPGTVVYKTDTVQHRFDSAKTDSFHHQRWAAWWHEIQVEARANSRRPIILIHENSDHYTLFRVSQTHLKAPKLKWAQSTIDQYIKTHLPCTNKRSRSAPSSPYSRIQCLPLGSNLVDRFQDDMALPVDMSPLMLPSNPTAEILSTPNPRPLKRAQHASIPDPMEIESDLHEDKSIAQGASTHEQLAITSLQCSHDTSTCPSPTEEELRNFTTLYTPYPLPTTAAERKEVKAEIQEARRQWNTTTGADTPLPSLSSSKPLFNFITQYTTQWTAFVAGYQDPLHILATLSPAMRASWSKHVDLAYRWMILDVNRRTFIEDPSLSLWLEALDTATDADAAKLLQRTATQWEIVQQSAREADYTNLLSMLQAKPEIEARNTLLVTAVVFPRVLAHDFPVAQDGHFILHSTRFYQGSLLSLKGMERLLTAPHPFTSIIHKVAQSGSWEPLQDHLAAVTHRPFLSQV
jgi:hypothetical protein